MNLFKRHTIISFSKHDPLDNGLSDEIDAEQNEEDSFQTLSDTSGEELSKQWSAIVKDIEKDPDWFTFNND